MAVDAHHLLSTGHQPAAAAAMGAAAPFSAPSQYIGYGSEVAGGTASSQGYESYMGLPPSSSSSAAAATATVGLQDQYSQFLTLVAVDLVQRGVTFGGRGAQEMTTNKRKRAEHSPVLGTTDVASAHSQQQLIVVDRLLLNHAAKMWTALAEQRRRHMRLIAAAVEAKAAKRLKAKDEEIERIRRVNCALEEGVRTICAEVQAWRDAAQSSVATANVLRGELERALRAQACRGGGASDVDAESCCCGENDVAVYGEEEEVGTAVERRATGAGKCKGCGDGAAVVLLLPCRHLCVCATCAAAVPACPACGCAKNGSVCVNFS